MKKLFFTLILTLCFKGFSQNYISHFEKKVVEDYEKNPQSFDFISSLIALDSTSTSLESTAIKQELDEFVKTLPPKEEKVKREKKRIKRMYESVHERFFRKYEDIVYFSQIFENGTYNCVSATAVYAYIFDQIDVPYALKHAPGHVFMIAYPDSYKIILETTAPGAYGFISPKDSDVKDQIQQLLDFKLITEEEVSEKGESKVFMDFFYGEERLGKEALVGMQYHNKGLEYLEEEAYKKALNCINRSLTFFPYKPSEFLRIGLIGLSLEETEYNTEQDIEYLVEVLNTDTFSRDVTTKDIEYMMSRILQHDDNDLDFIKIAAAKMDQISNPEFKNTSREVLYEYVAKKSANKLELKEAMIASDSLLVTNPKSKIAKEIISYSIGREIAKALVNEDNLNALNTYREKYEFLKGDLKIESLRAMQYGMLAQKSFKNKNPAQAKKYLVDFESVVDTYGEKLEINAEAIAQLYLFAGRYYYGKLRNIEALEFFEKGLSYNPQHSELKKMKRWVTEDMN